MSSTTTTITTTRTKYHRMRERSRRSEYFELNTLEYLDKTGPTSITELCFVLQTNHRMISQILRPLIAAELVVRKSLEDVGIMRYTGGRKRIVTTSPTARRMSRISSHVQVLLVITPLGKKYLKKQTRLQKYIHWKE